MLPVFTRKTLEFFETLGKRVFVIPSQSTAFGFLQILLTNFFLNSAKSSPDEDF